MNIFARSARFLFLVIDLLELKPLAAKHRAWRHWIADYTKHHQGLLESKRSPKKFNNFLFWLLSLHRKHMFSSFHGDIYLMDTAWLYVISPIRQSLLCSLEALSMFFYFSALLMPFKSMWHSEKNKVGSCIKSPSSTNVSCLI